VDRTLAVIIPVFGAHEYTTALIRDLRREEEYFDLYVVDNRGDYVAHAPNIVTLIPGANLGWAGGCNYGLESALAREYSHFMLLNNDTRLSPSFVSSMVDASHHVKADVIGPVYDHNWPQQRVPYDGPAAVYKPRCIETPVPFIDGTCMMISRATLDRVGMLDACNWPRFGWGCDKDLCLRVRLLGGSVWVTQRSYLNHFARGTAAKLPGFSEDSAECENNAGMVRKWGHGWLPLLYDGFGDLSRVGLVQQRLDRARSVYNTPPTTA
jgi:GT2 family glycosyltransferase